MDPREVNAVQYVEELEENLKDAYRMMVLEDVPEGYLTKEITL